MIMKPEHAKAARLMKREPINPIGKCFDSSAHQAVYGDDPPEDMRICHGIGIANMPGEEGHQMGHAWLEWSLREKRIAFDTTWGVATCAAHYRKMLRVSYVVEYTRDEFLKNWIAHDMPGPWDEKIREVTDAVRRGR